MANSLWTLFGDIWHSKPVRVGVYGAQFGQRFIGIYALLMLVYSLQFGFPIYNLSSSQASGAQSATVQATFSVDTGGQ